MDARPRWDIDLDSLVGRRLERALLLVRTDREGETGAVLDAATGGFVRLPSSPEWILLPLALSWDGALVVMEAAQGQTGASALMLYRLADGVQWLCPVPGGWTHHAVLSPDGRTLATTDGDGEAGTGWVMLTDIDSRTERRLWTGDGPPCALSWSPDGRHLAVTCEIDDGFSVVTTVVEVVTGAPAARFPGSDTLNSPNGSWTGNSDLVLFPFDDGDGPGPFMIADIDQGKVRQCAPRPADWTGGCHAILDGRLIQSFWDKGLYSTGLDGTDPQPLLSVAAGRAVTVVDVAPLAPRR